MPTTAESIRAFLFPDRLLTHLPLPADTIQHRVAGWNGIMGVYAKACKQGKRYRCYPGSLLPIHGQAYANWFAVYLPLKTAILNHNLDEAETASLAYIQWHQGQWPVDHRQIPPFISDGKAEAQTA